MRGVAIDRGLRLEGPPPAAGPESAAPKRRPAARGAAAKLSVRSLAWAGSWGRGHLRKGDRGPAVGREAAVPAARGGM